MHSRGLFFTVLVGVALAHAAVFHHARVTYTAAEVSKERVVSIRLHARLEEPEACPHPQPRMVAKPKPVSPSETVSVAPPHRTAAARPQPEPPLPAPVSEPEHEREEAEAEEAVNASEAIAQHEQEEQKRAAAMRAEAENVYLDRLKAAIEAQKRYPAIARRLGQSGRVLLGFTLDQNGAIVAVRVVESTPHERLNRAALEILERIGRFDPIPETLRRERWHITVPILYDITQG